MLGSNETERAEWLTTHVLDPIHHYFDREYSIQEDGNLEIMGIPAPNLSMIIMGATNSFFIHSFQMKQMYGVNPFDKEQIEQHADIVMDLLFARFK